MLSTIQAGDTLRYTRRLEPYPAGSGWQIKLRLVPQASGADPILVVGTADGDTHVVHAAATDTASWSGGAYSYIEWVERAGESFSTDQGQTRIAPNLRTASAGLDGRSLAQKALADCRQALATFRATRGMQRKYRIGEREMDFSDTAQILKEIKYWEAEVNKEDVAAGRKNAFAGRIAARI